uniref:Uncharacterized protein n=1 Tax=Anguilla anguilla TaxID=7936 RepID=A0A0E9SG23_ANGAN
MEQLHHNSIFKCYTLGRPLNSTALRQPAVPSLHGFFSQLCQFVLTPHR